MEKYNLLIKEFRKLEKNENLKLDGLHPDEIPATTVDFLFKFINNWNYGLNTINSEGDIVTGVNRRRSINETYYLIKSYFPRYTVEKYLEDLFELVYQIDKKYPEYVLVVHWCPDIERPVLYKRIKSKVDKDYLLIDHTDIFPVTFQWKYSMANSQFLQLLSEKEVVEQIVKDKYINK